MSSYCAQNSVVAQTANVKQTRFGVSGHVDSCEIVPYAPKYRKRILRLQQNLWHTNQGICDDYFRWKYEENPYVDDIYIRLALDGAAVVGMVGIFVTRWQMGEPSQTFELLSLADMIIEPSYRGRGLEQQLIQDLVDSISWQSCPFLFDMSAAPQVVLSLRMSGWHSAYVRSAQWEPDVQERSAMMAWSMAAATGGTPRCAR